MNNQKQPRIVMAVTNDLVTDRRVLRHAATLREAGCEVELVGKTDLHVRSPKKWCFYAEYNLRLLLHLLHTRADIVWANDTDTLPACWLAARLRGKRLVMDSHEIFPEVPELVGRPRVKHVWEWIEDRLLPRCDANLTVCQSVADHYKGRYGVDMVVVRNLNGKKGVESGEWKTESGKWRVGNGEWRTESGERRVENGEQRTESGAYHSSLLTPHSSLKTLLYQGAVNLGRGIDWAIDALEWLPQCRLVVAGVGDLYDEMRAYAAAKPWANRIEFLGRLNPEVLERLTPQADVGLVMLEDLGLNYRCALPNRVGDFVAAGVPMVVSDMPEMAAVVRRFGVGEIVRGTGARPLADAIEKVLAHGPYDFAAARADMDWDKEKQKLIQLVARS